MTALVLLLALQADDLRKELVARHEKRLDAQFEEAVALVRGALPGPDDAATKAIDGFKPALRKKRDELAADYTRKLDLYDAATLGAFKEAEDLKTAKGGRLLMEPRLVPFEHAGLRLLKDSKVLDLYGPGNSRLLIGTRDIVEIPRNGALDAVRDRLVEIKSEEDAVAACVLIAALEWTGIDPAKLAVKTEEAAFLVSGRWEEDLYSTDRKPRKLVSTCSFVVKKGRAEAFVLTRERTGG